MHKGNFTYKITGDNIVHANIQSNKNSTDQAHFFLDYGVVT